jgi:hypothetical protein
VRANGSCSPLSHFLEVPAVPACSDWKRDWKRLIDAWPVRRSGVRFPLPPLKAFRDSRYVGFDRFQFWRRLCMPGSRPSDGVAERTQARSSLAFWVWERVSKSAVLCTWREAHKVKFQEDTTIERPRVRSFAGWAVLMFVALGCDGGYSSRF